MLRLDQTFMTFLLQHQRKNRRTLNFLILMESIMAAARKIESLYHDGALQNNLGEAGKTNVQGESVMAMDEMAHKIVLHYLRESGQVMEVTSEESANEIRLDEDGRYIVYFDPIDGSSNVKHSLPVGFLFAVVKRDLDKAETYRLRTGREFIASGMFLIPSGLFTFALRNAGAWRFILDETGVYVRPSKLTFPNDKSVWELSYNAAYRPQFLPSVTKWLDKNETSFKFRYAGSLVVDFHRLIHNGGCFMYPEVASTEGETPRGKLRLLYEAAVVAFIANEAGGAAIDHNGDNMLDVLPTDRHQRSGLYVGNTELIEKLQAVIKK